MYDEFQEAFRAFEEGGAEDPLVEALHLIDIISGGALRGIDPSLVRSFLDQQDMTLQDVAQERNTGIPLEYIVGRAAFAGLRLHCLKGALIPTEWTKLLVDVTLDIIEERQESETDQTIMEIGTGCGNIAVSLAMRAEGVRILASDVSPEAVEIAQKNVDEFDLSDKVAVYCGDLFSPFHGSEDEGAVDLVVCNPPYIPTGSLSKLSHEILEHEPAIALDAGPYGMDFYRRLIADSVSMLKPGGILVFEIGVGQERLVTRILGRNKGYEDARCFKDPDGQTRVMSAVRAPLTSSPP